jgi:hypothetical protein
MKKTLIRKSPVRLPLNDVKVLEISLNRYFNRRFGTYSDSLNVEWVSET